MSMGTRRQRQRQEPLWITHTDLARAPGHPFYKRLNQLLDEGKFDEFAEKECAKFYAHSFSANRSEEHTSELQSRLHLVCRLLLEKKKKKKNLHIYIIYIVIVSSKFTTTTSY